MKVLSDFDSIRIQNCADTLLADMIFFFCIHDKVLVALVPVGYEYRIIVMTRYLSHIVPLHYHDNPNHNIQ
jgi:hypothetical protein